MAELVKLVLATCDFTILDYHTVEQLLNRTLDGLWTRNDEIPKCDPLLFLSDRLVRSRNIREWTTPTNKTTTRIPIYKYGSHGRISI